MNWKKEKDIRREKERAEQTFLVLIWYRIIELLNIFGCSKEHHLVEIEILTRSILN
jgi:hypothetical protein